MAKMKEEPQAVLPQVENVFVRPSRMVVPVPCRPIDTHIETEQNKSQTVAKLFQDYVLGRLDPSQIGGSVHYDPEGSDEVDDFNHFGIELEDMTRIQEHGLDAMQEIRRKDKEKKEKKEKKDTEQSPTPSLNDPGGTPGS